MDGSQDEIFDCEFLLEEEICKLCRPSLFEHNTMAVMAATAAMACCVSVRGRLLADHPRLRHPIDLQAPSRQRPIRYGTPIWTPYLQI